MANSLNGSAGQAGSSRETRSARQKEKGQMGTNFEDPSLRSKSGNVTDIQSLSRAPPQQQQQQLEVVDITSSSTSTLPASVNVVSDDLPDAIFQIRTGHTDEKAVICVPGAFRNRRDVAKKINRHGGLVTLNPAISDVVLLDEDTSLNYPAERVAKKIPRGAGIVTLKWLDDSIARGEMQNFDRYKPSIEETPQESERVQVKGHAAAPIAKR